jgi:hypothetical protein
MDAAKPRSAETTTLTALARFGRTVVKPALERASA